MKHLINVLFLLSFSLVFSQSDFSKNWEDFFSYNNAKDFIKVGSKLYVAVDNGIFIYDETTNTTTKYSSVNGLSGKTVTTVFFDENTENIFIGYESGLIEIIDKQGAIHISADIERLNITGDKQINNIFKIDDKLLLATPFGIVVYNTASLQFGDTYFIDEGSNPIFVNQTVVLNDVIYAATAKGIYTADLNNPNLIDFNNWNQPQNDFTGNFSYISVFNDKIFATKNNILYRLNEQTGHFESVKTLSSSIRGLKTSNNNLSINTLKQTLVLNSDLQVVANVNTTARFNFTLHTSFADSENVYLATNEFGILKSPINDVTHLEEIHPEGPSSNKVFSISVKNNNLWVVYGGYDDAYTPLGKRFGFSHFNGGNWINTPYSSTFPARDFVYVTIDPNHDNKAYISSWNDGVLVVEDDIVTTLLDNQNSGLEKLFLAGAPNFKSIRINGSAF